MQFDLSSYPFLSGNRKREYHSQSWCGVNSATEPCLRLKPDVTCKSLKSSFCWKRMWMAESERKPMTQCEKRCRARGSTAVKGKEQDHELSIGVPTYECAGSSVPPARTFTCDSVNKLIDGGENFGGSLETEATLVRIRLRALVPPVIIV